VVRQPPRGDGRASREPRAKRLPARLAAPLALGACAAFGALVPRVAPASPLPVEQVRVLCAGASDPSDCGKRVEAAQLARFPELAKREGDSLTISMTGTEPKRYVDREAETWAVWGYYPAIDAVLLYTVRHADTLGFTLLLRATGAEAPLANEPLLSPDSSRLVTSDFCAKGCDNEIVVWRVERESARKERLYRPRTEWQDVSVRWKDAATLAVERRTASAPTPLAFDFRLSDPGWTRVEGR
jgi:hypothetical protein